MNYTILVTGSEGYIARSIINILSKKNFKLILIDKKESSFKKKNCIFYKGDFSNKKVLDKIFLNKVDLIIHLAAYIDVSESINLPNKYIENNYIKSVKLFNYCISKNIKNIIFASSSAVYGKMNHSKPIKEIDNTYPNNTYGLSKKKTEIYLKRKNKKLNFVSLRFFNVTGYNEIYNKKNYIKNKKSIFNQILKNIYNKKKLIINGKNHKTKDGFPVRDYIHVDDIANIILKLINKFKKNYILDYIFNCGSGSGDSVLDVIKKFEKIYQIKLEYTVRDNIKGNVSNVVSNSQKLNNFINYKLKKSNIGYIIREFKKKSKI